MISITIIVSAIFNRVLFTKACRDFISAILGFNNWYQIFNNISYFDNGGAPSPLLHCWSLAIETQFYLIFPIIIILVSKFKSNKNERNRILSIITLLLIVISTSLMALLFQPTGDPSRVYYGLDTRAFSLLVGAFLAIITQCDFKVSLKKSVYDIGGIISLFIICLIVGRVAGYDEFLYKGGYLIVSILTAFVILSILRKNSILSKILSISVIDWLGKLSYSIYLWHYPIIILMSGGKKSSILTVSIEILLTLIMSVISYYVIETPIRKGIIDKTFNLLKEKKYNTKLKKGLSTISLCLVLIISSVLCVAFVPKETMSNNIASTTPKKEKTVEKQMATETTSDDDMLYSLDLLILGDSVADGASEMLHQTFPSSPIDAKVSRHCSESVPIFQTYLDHGWDGTDLVYSLGTNGPVYDFLPKIRSMLPKDKPMFILTIRAPYEQWSDDNNEKIKKFCDENDNVYLIDWASYSKGQDDWFVSDETHLTNEGTVGFSNCIKEKILEVFKDKK